MHFEEGNSHSYVAKMSMANAENRFAKRTICQIPIISMSLDRTRQYAHGTTTRSTCPRCGLRTFYLLGEPKDLSDAFTLNKQCVIGGWKMYRQYILSNSIIISQPACLSSYSFLSNLLMKDANMIKIRELQLSLQLHVSASISQNICVHFKEHIYIHRTPNRAQFDTSARFHW